MTKTVEVNDKLNIDLQEETEMIEQVEEITVDGIDKDGLKKEVEESLERLSESIQLIGKKAKRSWKDGFITGYGTAVTGFVLGAAFIKIIKKKSTS